MLKRQQILMNDWLAEHLKKIADKYDLSYSEIVRVSTCLQVLRNIQLVFPKCACEENMEKRLHKIIKEKNSNKAYNAEEMHKFLSDLYFQTRKAAECWDQKMSSNS